MPLAAWVRCKPHNPPKLGAEKGALATRASQFSQFNPVATQATRTENITNFEPNSLPCPAWSQYSLNHHNVQHDHVISLQSDLGHTVSAKKADPWPVLRIFLGCIGVKPDLQATVMARVRNIRI